MKKVLFFSLAAGLALAACTKNEVRPVEVDQEITYQTITTKAASAMNEGNHFISYAYFLEKDKKWDTDNDRNGASAYISAAEISHHDEPDCWKAASPYYWPKQGSLTFFAWSDNDNNPSVTPTPTCSIEKGIKVSPYDITANKNVDFLVAEIVKDQTKNTSPVANTSATGVPTVFKHTLSKLEFQVQTVDNNGNAKDYSSEDITFTVKSITLNSVKNKRNYAQTWRKDASGPVASGHVWSDTTLTQHIPVPVFTGNQAANSTPTKLTKDNNTDYEIVIPQEFEADDSTEDLLEIQYDITTSYTGTPVVEHVTQTVKLSDVYPNDWKVNKFYTLLIKLSVNEIYWAPTVEDWEPVATTEEKF